MSEQPLSTGLPEFDKIGKGVIDELGRRVGSPVLAQDLPGTLLMKFAETYLKAVERNQALEEAKLKQDKLDPLEMIDQEGLSTEKRIAILAEYLDEVEEHWRSASTRMEELLTLYGEEQNVGAVLSEVSEVVPEVEPV